MKSLDEILGDFNAAGSVEKGAAKKGAPVTIWLPAEDKARYDKLQAHSGRRFSRKAREALIALIYIAEARAG